MPVPRFDLPNPDVETKPYWDAARDHRLLIQRCASCGGHQFYPRPFCKVCWSTDTEWVQASGSATLYSFSVVHQNDLPPFPERVPYVAAVVDLAEGPRMISNVTGCDRDDLAIGMDLEVSFEEIDDDVVIPVFRPAPTPRAAT
ncbi:MAG: Zn-ribbon domain-containing OB-fold protein [Acidimicrobiia bacterium]